MWKSSKCSACSECTSFTFATSSRIVQSILEDSWIGIFRISKVFMSIPKCICVLHSVHTPSLCKTFYVWVFGLVLFSVRVNYVSSLLTVKGRFGWGRRMLKFKKSTRMRLREIIAFCCLLLKNKQWAQFTYAGLLNVGLLRKRNPVFPFLSSMQERQTVWPKRNVCARMHCVIINLLLTDQSILGLRLLIVHFLVFEHETFCQIPDSVLKDYNIMIIWWFFWHGIWQLC